MIFKSTSFFLPSWLCLRFLNHSSGHSLKTSRHFYLRSFIYIQIVPDHLIIARILWFCLGLFYLVLGKMSQLIFHMILSWVSILVFWSRKLNSHFCYSLWYFNRIWFGKSSVPIVLWYYIIESAIALEEEWTKFYISIVNGLRVQCLFQHHPYCHWM